ncbi:protein EARLY FLOWERING 3-like isoform X1 [Punica granatum]|uniref:Protein EARLY FLOWERING 3-like isoform X1 n=2 Tax=Punica granatum TaxID=22663 RepID=A0A6P8BU82_PUNGR|nr:protein EARLY FLOWERING 3-like isoform X1 [Punica granatum]
MLSAQGYNTSIMKRGKDGERLMGPMFPRLHVNDADKGGPRAPPRNKMALYEQLSIPSQRFNPGLLPGNPNISNSFPTSSSSQMNVADRKNFFPLYMPLSEPAFLPEKLNSLQSDRSNSKASLTQFGQHNKPGDEDDCTVPVLARSRECYERTRNIKESESSMAMRIQTQNTGIERYAAVPNNINGESNGVDKCPRESGNNESLREIELANAPEPRRNSHSGNTERSDDLSEASILDSVSAMDISPDDVVGIIGQKRFWKARRAIVNQQRVFAVQVFELHRLIKVQQLIAGSAHLLTEDASTLSKPSSKSSPAARLLGENDIKSPSPAVKHRDEPEKLTHPVECSAENAVGQTPVFSNKSALSGPLVSSTGPCGAAQPQPQPMGQQQWLIPVMSPTEGLVYKPYSAPGFGSTGFCAPHGASPMMMGNFGNPAYGVPAHQGMGFPGIPHGGHSYFPTYSMPIVSVGITGAGSGSISAVEQVNRPTEPTPGIETSQMLRKESNQPKFQSSCNNNSVPVPMATPAAPRLHTPKSDLQGSTASSPHNSRAEPTQTGSSLNHSSCKEVQGTEPVGSSEREREIGNAQSGDGKDELPLFLMSPATAEANRPTQVIRAVPHNARSTSASVARIFRFIQEERKQYDSV